MKSVFTLFLLLVSFAGISQTKAASITISKLKLAEAELITDLIKDIPVECKVTSYKFLIKINDKPFTINCVGNELRLEIQSAFKKANVGDKFSFDKMATACLEKHKKKYSFIITE